MYMYSNEYFTQKYSLTAALLVRVIGGNDLDDL